MLPLNVYNLTVKNQEEMEEGENQGGSSDLSQGLQILTLAQGNTWVAQTKGELLIDQGSLHTCDSPLEPGH